MSIRNFLLSFIWFCCVEQWKCFWIIIIRKRIWIFGSRRECLLNYIIWLGCFCVYLRETYVLYCIWVVICFLECLHYWMWFRELCDWVILVLVFEILVSNVSLQLGQFLQDEHEEILFSLFYNELGLNLKWTKHGTDLAV